MSTVIKFNAGKVQYDEETKRCTPLPHKGVVTIAPSVDDEGFFDFSWTPKSESGLEKDELLLIPGDMTFKPVKSCKTGRVVALTFLSSGDKSLYWLQDVGDDEDLDLWTAKDEALVKSVQELLTPSEDEDDDDADDHAENDNASESVGVTQEKAASLTTAVDLYPISSLSDVLTEDRVSKYLRTLSPEEIKSKFGHLLPEAVEPTYEQILEAVRSEFFRTSNAELSANMTESNIGSILSSSFGYEYNGEGIDAFLNGLREAEKKKRREP